MPVEVQPSWVGRRVSIRCVTSRGADGRPLFSDVVGDLVDLDGDVALVEHRDGLVEVAVHTVAIAKLVPPSSADELALEAVTARGIRPLHTAELGGWLLRADPAPLGRANSVLPLKPPGVPLEDALEQARHWYAAHGLPLRFAIAVESRRLLDAELGERGWAPSTDVLVLTTRLGSDNDAATIDTDSVRVGDAPSPNWLARYRDGALAPDAPRALLCRHDTVTFADLDEAAAIGRGVVDEQWLGIAAVTVDPARRRRGLGRQVAAALWAWGRAAGATRSYVQVSSDNLAGLAFWESLGYREHHAYRYRDDPTA